MFVNKIPLVSIILSFIQKEKKIYPITLALDFWNSLLDLIQFSSKGKVPSGFNISGLPSYFALMFVACYTLESTCGWGGLLL